MHFWNGNLRKISCRLTLHEPTPIPLFQTIGMNHRTQFVTNTVTNDLMCSSELLIYNDQKKHETKASFVMMHGKQTILRFYDDMRILTHIQDMFVRIYIHALQFRTIAWQRPELWLIKPLCKNMWWNVEWQMIHPNRLPWWLQPILKENHELLTPGGSIQEMFPHLRE